MVSAVIVFLSVCVAAVFAVGGGLALSGAAAFLHPAGRDDRQQATRIVRWLPAMGFAYLCSCILIFSLWSSLRGRDLGWGDTWNTPILGDYSMTMADTTDHATLYDHTDPGSFTTGGAAPSSARRDVIPGVRQLEVRSPYLIGTAVQDQPLASRGSASLFFILDTRTGTRTDLPSLPALQAAALHLGAPLRMLPVKTVYKRCRYTSADLLPLMVFAIPAVIGFWLVGSWFLRLRSSSGGSGHDVHNVHQRTHVPTGLYLVSVHGVSRAPSGPYSSSRY